MNQKYFWFLYRTPIKLESFFSQFHPDLPAKGGQIGVFRGDFSAAKPPKNPLKKENESIFIQVSGREFYKKNYGKKDKWRRDL